MFTTAAALARRAGRSESNRSSSAPGPLCENLESRQLFSTVYADLAGLVNPPEASVLGEGFRGPIAAVGDIDGDGVTDLLIGRAVATVDPVTHQLGGATLISGKTGQTLRIHDADPVAHFGWGVAALGDVDGDGIPDYGISNGASGSALRADVYSGKTGAVLYSFDDASRGDVWYTSIAPAGDMNHDGHADFLVSTTFDLMSAKDDEDQLRLVSGADGSSLFELTGVNVISVLGGRDFTGDGVADIAFTSIDPAADMTLTMISGQDKSTVFNVPAATLSATMQSGADFDGDGTADLLISAAAGALAGPVDAYSGKTGAHLFQLASPDVHGFAGPAAIITDVDQDGTPDIAAAIPTQDVRGDDPRNAIMIYSGRDRSVIARITDTGPATISPPVLGNRRMNLSGPFAVADLDGDGFGELIASAYSSVQQPGSIFDTHEDRIVTFDLATLGDPVFDGASTDPSGGMVAWGHLGHRGFLFRGGRFISLSDLVGFDSTDQVLLYRNDGTHTVIVAGPGGDRARAHAWFGGADLSFIARAAFDDAPVIGLPPPGTYVFARAVAITSQSIVVERTNGGGQPTSWRFIYAFGPSGVTTTLSYHDLGTPVGAAEVDYGNGPVEIVATISAQNPDDGVITIIGGLIYRLQGFRPEAVSPSGEVAGLRQGDRDAVPMPYVYRGHLPGVGGGYEYDPRAVDLAAGAHDFHITDANLFGEVAGTYVRGDGTESVFLIRRNALGVVMASPWALVDLIDEKPVGLPETKLHDPAVIGLHAPQSRAATNELGEVYFTYTDDTGVRRSAAVTYFSNAAGPFRAPSDADFVVSDDGQVVATRTLDGHVIVFQNTAAGWQAHDITYVFPYGVFDEWGAAYITRFFGDILTWTSPYTSKPSIALATAEGTILIEPWVQLKSPLPDPSVDPAHYPRELFTVRNLTTEIPGATAIVDSFITLQPHDGRRMLAGLDANGDLVFYAMKDPLTAAPTTDAGGPAWTYTNLFDDVLRPTAAHEPVFTTDQTGDLIGYVTAWNGLNIAGVDSSSNQIIVFWTAGGQTGWRASSLDQALAPGQTASTSPKNLSVYLTPWGGINVVNGDSLNVYWWTPGLGGSWRADNLSDIARGPQLRSETMTTYITPWGGLNVAGLDAHGQLWVYWWAPGGNWKAETLDSSLSPADRAIRRTGRVAAAVSPAGLFSLFARTTYGNVVRYSWSPTQPWALDFVSPV